MNGKIQSANSVVGKETVYVDVDDEITAIIDKVQAAKSKVVALVLPKRATVLQSIVNMKLLKRSAENAKKNLVLITSEAGLLPLAGSVGLFVASTPTSKPSIPSTPAVPDDETEQIDDSLEINDTSTAPEDTDFDPAAVAGVSVGELAAAGAVHKVATSDVDESIDMSDDEATQADTSTATPKPKKNKKLRVPNFDSFRKKIALGVVALIVLIMGWIFAFTVLPKATVTIHTDSSTITTNLNLVLQTTAKTLDTTNGIVPATAQSQQKTATQQVASTGQQNNGDKANGTVTFTASVCSPPFNKAPSSIPTGSTVKANGHNYSTQSTATYGSPTPDTNCVEYTTGAVPITAFNGGTDYNVDAGTKFSGAGSGTGSASGGTDDITKIVTQTDIDSATAKMKTADTSAVKQQLVSGLQSKGLQPISTTFLASDPQVTTSAKVGDAVDTVSVTSVTTYTMLGVNKSDLQKLVVGNVDGQLDKGKQVILDDGVANAVFTQANPATATGASIAMEAKSEAGPQLDAVQLKKQLAGKKAADVKSYIKQTPGVTDVTVHYSPFWVSSIPGKVSKVTITIVKASN